MEIPTVSSHPSLEHRHLLQRPALEPGIVGKTTVVSPRELLTVSFRERGIRVASQASQIINKHSQGAAECSTEHPFFYTFSLPHTVQADSLSSLLTSAHHSYHRPDGEWAREGGAWFLFPKPWASWGMLRELEVGWEGGWTRGLKQVGEEADCSKSMKSQRRVFLCMSSLVVKTMGSGVRLWGSDGSSSSFSPPGAAPRP